MAIKEAIKKNSTLANISAWLYSLGTNQVRFHGLNNSFIRNNAFARGCHINIYGNCNKIEFAGGIGRLMNITITIHGNGNVVSIGKDASIDGLRISIEDDGNQVFLGARFTGGGNSELAAIEGTNIILGDDCMLSANITVRTGDSHSVLDAASGRRINKATSILIGNHVWIGNTVLIFKGSQIGNNCIVAGGSVVTGKIAPDNTIIGGNPAKVVKEGVNWCTERLKI